MPTKPPVIFAIDPGTKELGFALFAGCELVYFGVKTIKPRPSDEMLVQEMIRLMTGLIRRYEPQVLAIEQTAQIQYNAALLHRVAAALQVTAQEQGLTVYEYAPAVIRQRICQRQDASKQRTAKRLVTFYPELNQYHQPGSRWKELYWAHLFDAVAVGLVCWWQLRAQEARKCRLFLTDPQNHQREQQNGNHEGRQ